MIKLNIARAAAATVASAGLIASSGGIAGATSWSHGYGGDYGGRHHPAASSKVLTDTNVQQTNNVAVNNMTHQDAYTGVATVNGSEQHHRHFRGEMSYDRSSNGNGGSAMTGYATNTNATNIGGTVKNTPPAPVVVQPLSAPKHSTSLVKTTSYVQQTNNVEVNNTTDQTATTGDATVNGGSGGNAVTGDASNYNSTKVTLDVQN